ncbi:serine carboxypeptidase-like 42 isoform X2 [Selaginella moellendorffii]|nr:serine carboxypeptidase-like 42 isoform X2 [Selaginella moellendorffii]|eukprot:XP_002972549.2 serine carboxypeptidase-like 42 isoform X2 [Selaginella moellendorffii]
MKRIHRVLVVQLGGVVPTYQQFILCSHSNHTKKAVLYRGLLDHVLFMTTFGFPALPFIYSLASPWSRVVCRPILIMQFLVNLCCCCCCLGFLAGFVAGAPASDLVKDLPGQPDVSFKQYAGYVTIDQRSGKALFYYFVEAEEDPTSKPLSLWLNGGPGCSSLGGGAFTELGPFYPDSKSDGLVRNSKAWNKASNVLFVDSPIGVGWSYSNTSSDYQTYNDEKTSRDLVKFLHGWFIKFPEYRHREFYITGESYAGHYVPQLAVRLLNHNKLAKKSHQFNLKGLAIGNPALNSAIDDEATYDYYWSHGLISDKTYQGIVHNCNWHDYDYSGLNHNVSVECVKYISQTNTEVGQNVDPYDVLLDACLPEAVHQEFRLRKMKSQRSIGVDICITRERTRYFRRPEVQRALHANTTGLPYEWSNCEGPLFYDNGNLNIDMVTVLENLLVQGLRIFIYSGDADSVVPFLGTRTIIDSIVNRLRLKTLVPYSAWYSQSQVAGWTQVTGNLTFATVKGAGHMVPYAQPMRALVMFQAFVNNKNLPRQ